MLCGCAPRIAPSFDLGRDDLPGLDMVRWLVVSNPLKSLPLDGAGGFRGDVVNNPVDAAHLVDDAGRDIGQERMVEGIGIGRHAVGLVRVVVVVTKP